MNKSLNAAQMHIAKAKGSGQPIGRLLPFGAEHIPTKGAVARRL
jgi:hypothetical protein